MATIRIPPVLRAQTGGSREVHADGETVGAALHHLTDQYPVLATQLFQDGNLQRFINVYVNDQDIQFLKQLDTPVAPSDTIIILPAMAGGSDVACAGS